MFWEFLASQGSFCSSPYRHSAYTYVGTQITVHFALIKCTQSMDPLIWSISQKSPDEIQEHLGPEKTLALEKFIHAA